MYIYTQVCLYIYIYILYIYTHDLHTYTDIPITCPFHELSTNIQLTHLRTRWFRWSLASLSSSLAGMEPILPRSRGHGTHVLVGKPCRNNVFFLFEKYFENGDLTLFIGIATNKRMGYIRWNSVCWSLLSRGSIVHWELSSLMTLESVLNQSVQWNDKRVFNTAQLSRIQNTKWYLVIRPVYQLGFKWFNIGDTSSGHTCSWGYNLQYLLSRMNHKIGCQLTCTI